MDEATQKVIDQIEKLLRVAAKTASEAEAAAFTAKANALLAAHNLTVSEVENSSTDGTSGRRLDEQVSGGGMYNYQRNLWRNIAELNFCMYWTQVVRLRQPEFYNRGGITKQKQFTYGHRLVGRQVNVIATRNLANYLNSVIERLCRERLQDRTDQIVKGNNQFYSRWAIAFREGVADRVVEKIQERREAAIKDEQKKARAAAREAARKGHVTSTALTLNSLKDRERQSNYDFLYGEGAWARKEAAKAERDKHWAEARKAEAKAEAEAQREYTRWAKANPEEAAALERKAAAKQRARDRARQRRLEQGGGWGRQRFAESAEDVRRRSSGYSAGWDAGAGISIDQQVDAGEKKRIGHG